MKLIIARYIILALIFYLKGNLLSAQEINDSLLVSFDLGEIVVFEEYPYKNQKEENEFKQLEEDLYVVYPLVQIVRKEYARINKDLSLYHGTNDKEFMKWYENYAKDNYMQYLSDLNPRQGRLFLKLISRELNYTPYELIKEYRNGFRAVLWQGAARFFLANLKIEYDKEEYPMIEYLIKKFDAENGV
ncbi:MAG: DUF4294 domain-containing protein [Prolixibacteraceae bacterium]